MMINLLSTPFQEGIIILLIGMSIVFLSLLALFAVFQFLVPLLISKVLKRQKNPLTIANKERDEDSGSGEEMTAICTAIYMFLEEAHDEENAIITIHQSPKMYSPWSSKIYVTHKVR